MQLQASGFQISKGTSGILSTSPVWKGEGIIFNLVCSFFSIKLAAPVLFAMLLSGG